MVTMPVFEDQPNIGTQEYTRLIAITPTSKRKDEAIKKQYSKNLKDLEGKNVNVVITLEPAPTKSTSIHMDYVVIATVRALGQLNTALRTEAEAAKKTIDQVIRATAKKIKKRLDLFT